MKIFANPALVFVGQVKTAQNLAIPRHRQLVQGDLQHRSRRLVIYLPRLVVYMCVMERNSPIILVNISLFFAVMVNTDVDGRLADKRQQAPWFSQLTSA